LGRICAETPGAELQAIHIRIARLPVYANGGRQVDADLRACDGRFVIQFIADDVDAESEFIDEGVAENVGLSDAAKPAVKGYIQREIQVVDAGVGRRLNAERVCAKRLVSIGVRPEKRSDSRSLPLRNSRPIRGDWLSLNLPGSSKAADRSSAVECRRWW